jgi:hypothetical protein
MINGCGGIGGVRIICKTEASEENVSQCCYVPKGVRNLGLMSQKCDNEEQL